MFPRPRFLPRRPEPILHHIRANSIDGTHLAVTEWRPFDASKSKRKVVLLHATGFHSRCWDEVVRKLDCSTHCIGIDLRGHGRSDKPDPQDGMYPWLLLGEDVVAVLDALRIDNAVGVGHSCGGWVLLHAALSRPSAFSHLLLVDPVVQYANRYERWGPPDPSNPSPIARRKNSFGGPQEMVDRLKDKTSYRPWNPESLADYCGFGLLPENEISHRRALRSKYRALPPRVEDGRMVCLACPPWAEAATYAGSAETSERHRYIEIRAPTIILRAEKGTLEDGPSNSESGDFSASPTDPGLVNLFVTGVAEDVHLKSGMTHFIPMQNPGIVVKYIESFLVSTESNL